MSKSNILKIFLKLSWKISPSYFIGLMLQTLFSSGQLIVNVILPKYLIDELTGAQEKNKLILYALFIVGSNLLFALFNNIMKRFMDEKNLYMKDKMNEVMAEKIMKVEYSYLENPYYLDLKERAKFAVYNMNTMYSLITNIGTLLKDVVTILGLLTIMGTLGPIFLLILMSTIVVMLVIQKMFLKYELRAQQLIIPINRKYGYYVNLAFDSLIQKYVRLYHMTDMIVEHISTYNQKIMDAFQPIYKKKGLSSGSFVLITNLQAAFAYGYAGIRTITEWFGPRITIGSFTMYVNATIQFSSAVIDLGERIMNVNQSISYLEPFMEFMSLPDEDIKEGLLPFEGSIDSIRFENVSFHYPGSEKMVIENISFEIKKGEKISIVGLNGAGKTTLIKLICRLYHPSEGNIYINDKDIYSYEYKSYTNKIAAVFQDYRLFNYTIEENVTCKDIGSDTKGAMEVLEEVGLKQKIEELPKGIHSLFGKSYDTDGIEISGGQSQKVAIARALYKDASLIIMDEPTSALDPLAEAEIYENFNQLVGDKTAIYISHRMSSSTFCDKILVLENGSIKDFASHEELMKKTDSLYYELFNSQAVNYQY